MNLQVEIQISGEGNVAALCRLKKGKCMLHRKISYNVLIRAGVFLLLLVMFGAAVMEAQARKSADLIAHGKQIFRFDT